MECGKRQCGHIHEQVSDTPANRKRVQMVVVGASKGTIMGAAIGYGNWVR